MKIIQHFFILLLCFVLSCTNSQTTEQAVNDSKVVATAPASPDNISPTNSESPIAQTTEEPISVTVEESTEVVAMEKMEEEKREEIAKEEEKEVEEKRKAEVRKKKEKSRTKKRAKVEFKETEFDFGVIDQGDKIKHDFVFKNVGNADLEILNVDVTCGCTVPTFPFIPIAPGKKGKISITYNSTGKLGNQRPMITVVTNARPHTHKIYLKGVVDAERVKEKDAEKELPGNGL